MNELTFEQSLLTTILGCGIFDIDFLKKELEAFNVEFDDIYENGNEFNDVIGNIYFNITNKYDLNIGEDAEVFINCMDSHLYIQDKDGDMVEVFSEDDIKEVLEIGETNE